MMQVSWNGYISFQQAYNSFTPSLFPLSVLIPILAPLWADFDFRVSGAVYSRVTDDSDTLDQVVGMIAGLNPALSDYQPTLAVVVTWFEPRPHTESNPNAPPLVVTTINFFSWKQKH